MDMTQLLRIAEVRAQGSDGSARRIRESAGVSLREAAAALNSNAATLRRWENGESRPAADRALAWAALLDALTKARV
jgi:transcriptional regulator with XRE-family HTH domain